MSEKMTRAEFVHACEHVLDRMLTAADELNRLDGTAGDGDLGVTITLGCKAILKLLPEVASEDIGTIVRRSGMAFNTAAPSTVGALVGIGAMRAGGEAKGAEEVNTALLARMVRASEAGIKERGKAERGDKTLLDALGPAAEALERAVAEGRGLQEAARLATEAARSGVDATKGMRAKSGRAAWFAERSADVADPGATAVLRMFEAFEDFLCRM